MAIQESEKQFTGLRECLEDFQQRFNTNERAKKPRSSAIGSRSMTNAPRRGDSVKIIGKVVGLLRGF